MNKNDLEKAKKSTNQSGTNRGSISSSACMSNMNSNANDVTSKKGQISNESDASNFSDDAYVVSHYYMF